MNATARAALTSAAGGAIAVAAVWWAATAPATAVLVACPVVAVLAAGIFAVFWFTRPGASGEWGSEAGDAAVDAWLAQLGGGEPGDHRPAAHVRPRACRGVTVTAAWLLAGLWASLDAGDAPFAPVRIPAAHSPAPGAVHAADAIPAVAAAPVRLAIAPPPPELPGYADDPFPFADILSDTFVGALTAACS